MTYCFRDVLWSKLEEIILHVPLQLGSAEAVVLILRLSVHRTRCVCVPTILDSSSCVWGCCSIFVTLRFFVLILFY